MKTYAISIAILSLAAIGCGSSSTSTRGRTLGTSEGGEAGQTVVWITGGATSSVGGSVGTTGGTGGEVVQPSGGGEVIQPSGGAGNEPINTGGSGATPDATGGSGNVGGGCEPWDCTNIAINLAGWTPESGDDTPEACGLVQDPCSGQYIDCGGCSSPWQDCGRGNMIYDMVWGAIESDGTDNVCGGDCIGIGSCGDDLSTLVCTIADQPPSDECTDMGPASWCCVAGSVPF